MKSSKIRSKRSSEILKFTKTSKRNWPKGHISARKWLKGKNYSSHNLSLHTPLVLVLRAQLPRVLKTWISTTLRKVMKNWSISWKPNLRSMSKTTNEFSKNMTDYRLITSKCKINTTHANRNTKGRLYY